MRWLTACGSSSCIEVADGFDGPVPVVFIRCKDEHGYYSEICATQDEWRTFREGIRRGDFDEVAP